MKASLISLIACCAVAGTAFAQHVGGSTHPQQVRLTDDMPGSYPPQLQLTDDMPGSYPPQLQLTDDMPGSYPPQAAAPGRCEL